MLHSDMHADITDTMSNGPRSESIKAVWVFLYPGLVGTRQVLATGADDYTANSTWHTPATMDASPRQWTHHHDEYNYAQTM
jgi:hypothetical protein